MRILAILGIAAHEGGLLYWSQIVAHLVPRSWEPCWWKRLLPPADRIPLGVMPGGFWFAGCDVVVLSVWDHRCPVRRQDPLRDWCDGCCCPVWHRMRGATAHPVRRVAFLPMVITPGLALKRMGTSASSFDVANVDHSGLAHCMGDATD